MATEEPPARAAPTQREIEFELAGDWLASELARLLEAVERIYNALLTAELAAPTVRRRLVSRVEQAGREAVSQELGTPLFGTIGAGEGEEATSGAVHFGTVRVGEGEEALSSEGPITVTGPAEGIRLAFRPFARAQTSPDFRAVPFVRENLATLAPEALLKVRRIQISSPGVVTLEGSGEVIDETGKLIERLTLLNQRRHAARLANEKMRLDLAHQERQGQIALMRDEIALARERLQLIEEIFRSMYGDDFRNVPGVQGLMADVLSGAKDISELMSPVRPQLPPGSEPA